MSKKRSGKQKSAVTPEVEASVETDDFGFDEMSENNFDASENEAPEEEEEEITLPYPVQLVSEVRLGKQTYTELVFKNELTVGMVKHLPASGNTDMYKIGHFLPIIAAMTGVPTALIERLSIDDFKACSDVVANFL